MTLLPDTMRQTRALWHRGLGTLAFRCGFLTRARRRFHRVLELRGDDFGAYLYLGRIACSLGDYRGGCREFDHARRIAPDRFARIRHRLDLKGPRVAGTLLDETGERATWRPAPSPRRPFHQDGPEGSSWEVLAADTDLAKGERDPDPDWLEFLNGMTAPLSQHSSTRTHDDFTSAVERAKFADVAPITRQEIEASDLDELIGRLGEL